MAAHQFPRPNDLVIRVREGLGYTLARAPGPEQIVFATLDAAVECAVRFTRAAPLVIWLTTDGQVFDEVDVALRLEAQPAPRPAVRTRLRDPARSDGPLAARSRR